MIISGNNNHVVVWENGHSRELSASDNIDGFSEIRIEGNDNTLELEFPINAINNKIFIIGNKNYCKLSSTFKLWENTISFVSSEAYLNIKKNTTLRNSVIALGDKSIINIGKECMIADCDIRGTDSHAIIDIATGKAINLPSSPLSIGDRVWCCEKSRILKKGSIADGCIVGACAVVTRPFIESNCIIAGNPAQLIKRGVTWDRNDVIIYNEQGPYKY